MNQPNLAVTDVTGLIADLEAGTYERRISVALSQVAAAVVDAQKGDNVELEGAISEEISAYEGTTLRVTPLGLLQDWETFCENEDEEAAYEAYFAKKAAGFQTIEAL